MSLPDEFAGSGWTNLYSRIVGGIQVLYASFFGWIAFLSLRWTTEQLTRIAQKGFSFQGTTFKGEYLPALDLENLGVGMGFVLLSVCCLIGGYGLLRLRSWARRWETVYLIFVTVYSLWVLATEFMMGHDFGYIVLFTMAFTLPYLPFLLTSPSPQKVPLFRKAIGAKPVVDDLDGI